MKLRKMRAIEPVQSGRRSCVRLKKTLFDSAGIDVDGCCCSWRAPAPRTGRRMRMPAVVAVCCGYRHSYNTLVAAERALAVIEATLHLLPREPRDLRWTNSLFLPYR